SSIYSFPDGQAYVYGVEWHFLNAGIATVRIDPDGTSQKVSAIADSAGVANVLYAVHDHFEAQFDSKTFCSLGLNKHSEEGPQKRRRTPRQIAGERESLGMVHRRSPAHSRPDARQAKLGNASVSS